MPNNILFLKSLIPINSYAFEREDTAKTVISTTFFKVFKNTIIAHIFC